MHGHHQDESSGVVSKGGAVQPLAIEVIGEVKNYTTTAVSLTNQLKDDIAFALRTGRRCCWLGGDARSLAGFDPQPLNVVCRQILPGLVLP
jgi:hypothetical protein